MYGLARVTRIAGIGSGMFRAAIESMPPAEYLAASYYERWMYGVERRLERDGTLTPAEIDEGMARFATGPLPERSDPELAERCVAAQRERGADGGCRGAALPPRPARARDSHAAHESHALPPLRARRARRDRARPRRCHTLSGRGRRGEEEAPLEALYAVRFRSEDIFGPGEEPGFRVLVDLSETYLEEAPD